MIRTLCAMLLTAVMLPATLSADELVKCGALNFTHGGERGHKDVGAGVVSYSIFSFGHGQVARVLNIEACSTGDVLSASFYAAQHQPDQDDVVEIDATEATFAVFSDAVESDETVTFAQLGKRFAKAGAKVSRGVSQQESCACNRAYPDLRGDRTEFEWYN